MKRLGRWLFNFAAGVSLLLCVAKARAGLCAACGYDLRATPEKCPECGAVPAAKGAAT